MPIVLVHGGWGGGWTWRDTARVLRRQGYEVYAPTLTGMAERAHVPPEQVRLNTHISDIAGLLRFEELQDVLLVGHSYGGMVITGAADREIGRIAGMVYLDAFLPQSNQSLWDLTGQKAKDRQIAAAQAHDGGRTVPRSTSPALDDPASDRFQSLFTGQPLGCFSEKFVSVRPADERIWPRRHYVVCKGDPGSVFHTFAGQVQGQEGWDHSELDAMHDVVRSDPELTAGCILDIAQGWGIKV